jgi:hypothetical protein
MPTCDITVGKKFTINTQNFSSVSPTLSITFKDVIDINDLLKVHDLADTIADALFHKQMESDLKTMAAIKKLGFADYFKKVNESDIDEVLKESIAKIAKLPPF